MAVPHILKDGADSVGVAGATLRVYINIGMFSEYWLTRHNRLIGSVPATAVRDSLRARAFRLLACDRGARSNVAEFFRRLKAFRLADAPGGSAYITTDTAVMDHGREVFAESCASCHSSKQPPGGIDPRSAEGKAWFRGR